MSFLSYPKGHRALKPTILSMEAVNIPLGTLRGRGDAEPDGAADLPAWAQTAHEEGLPEPSRPLKRGRPSLL